MDFFFFVFQSMRFTNCDDESSKETRERAYRDHNTREKVYDIKNVARFRKFLILSRSMPALFFFSFSAVASAYC
jgi:hypothetical protein